MRSPWLIGSRSVFPTPSTASNGATRSRPLSADLDAGHRSGRHEGRPGVPDAHLDVETGDGQPVARTDRAGAECREGRTTPRGREPGRLARTPRCDLATNQRSLARTPRGASLPRAARLHGRTSQAGGRRRASSRVPDPNRHPDERSPQCNLGRIRSPSGSLDDSRGENEGAGRASRPALAPGHGDSARLKSATEKMAGTTSSPGNARAVRYRIWRC